MRTSVGYSPFLQPHLLSGGDVGIKLGEEVLSILIEGAVNPSDQDGMCSDKRYIAR